MFKTKENEHIKLKKNKYFSAGSLFLYLAILIIFPESLMFHQISGFIVAGIHLFLSVRNIALGSMIKQYHKPIIIKKFGLKVYNALFFSIIFLLQPINYSIKKADYSILILYISLMIYFFSFIRIKRISQKDL